MLAHLRVHGFVVRLPGAESVDVAVVHAEGGGDEHRVVDLEVGCAECSARGRRRSEVTFFPPCCTLPAMASRALSLGETGAVSKSVLTCLTMSLLPRWQAAAAPWLVWQK